jgi:hypothetical protein
LLHAQESEIAIQALGATGGDESPPAHSAARFLRRTIPAPEKARGPIVARLGGQQGHNVNGIIVTLARILA